MRNEEIVSKIEALLEMEELLEEVKAEVEKLKGEIKEELLKRETEELSAGRYIVRNTLVLSNRFDSTAFKKAQPEVYKVYTKPVQSRRFTVSK